MFEDLQILQFLNIDHLKMIYCMVKFVLYVTVLP